MNIQKSLNSIIHFLGCVFIASTVDFVSGGYSKKERARATMEDLKVARKVNRDYAKETERSGNTITLLRSILSNAIDS